MCFINAKINFKINVTLNLVTENGAFKILEKIVISILILPWSTLYDSSQVITLFMEEKATNRGHHLAANFVTLRKTIIIDCIF